MWTRKSLCITFLLLLSCFLFLPSAGFCSPAEKAEQDTLTISKKDWEILKANNAAQKKALEESQAALTEAKAELSVSQTALSEARKLLEASQMTSSEAQEKLMQLLNESAMQKAEIETLRKELSELKTESATASDALLKANQYLQDTKKEIEANEAAWRKRENQLERQRLLWQIISVLVGGAGVAIAT